MGGFGNGQWSQFYEFLDTILPKKGDSVQMPLNLKEEHSN